MRRFFNPETGIWRFFGVFGELLILSLLWFICSVPLVTLGASCTALYDTVCHCVRGDEVDLFHRFFSTFKAEFVHSLPSVLLWGAVLALTFLVFRQIAASALPDVWKIALYILLLLPAGMSCWVFPLLSRFTFTFPALTRTAFLLSFSHIFRTLALAVLMIAGLLLCAYLLLPVMFVPGLVALLNSALLEPVFRKYMP